jgi:hypothetical protein
MSDRRSLKEELTASPAPPGVHRTIVLGMIVGFALILISIVLREESSWLTELLHPHPITKVIGRIIDLMVGEIGVVLVSVWGISLFYEKYIADRHFKVFHSHLVDLVSRGESNAAVCESLGILRIYRDRQSYEEEHSFAQETSRLGQGDYLIIIGRSLIFLIYNWQRLMPLINNGAALQLCFIDPQFDDPTFSAVAGYSSTETTLAIERIKDSFIPWLDRTRPQGSVEIRFHRFALLDSYTEKKEGKEYRSAWDLNFGEGLQSRYVFYMDTKGIFAEKLGTQRYKLIWDRSEIMFKYQDGRVSINNLKGNVLVSDSG